MHSWINLVPTSQNNSKWLKPNSVWKTYIYVIRKLRVKPNMKIKMNRDNTKQGVVAIVFPEVEKEIQGSRT